jgi:hypothetical protein
MRGYYIHVKCFLQIALTSLLLIGVAQACDFKTEPAARTLLYRGEGWKMPALEHGKLSAPISFPASYSYKDWKVGAVPIPGVAVRVILFEAGERDASESGLFEIPRQEFEQDGKRRVMPSQYMGVTRWVYRYDVEGRVIAYTFGFSPVYAHGKGDQLKVDAEVSCVFDTTYVDDKGDGVFRILLPGGLTPDALPQWALDRLRIPN